MTKIRPLPTITARNFDELPHTLTVGEVAVLCSVVYGSVTYWISTYKIRARRAGGRWLVEKKDLLAFAQKRGLSLTYAQTERLI